MNKAWEIAREGQQKFGGKFKKYFAEALKIAWRVAKHSMDYVNQVKGTINKLVIRKLEGTEKQVAWAEQIRDKVSRTLQSEVMYEQYESVSRLPGGKSRIESRPIPAIITALKSAEGIKAHFEEMKNDNLPESRFVSTVKTMNDALGRYARFVEIMTNADTKFWIDNRDNQVKNHGFKEFIKYVNTGVKNY